MHSRLFNSLQTKPLRGITSYGWNYRTRHNRGLHDRRQRCLCSINHFANLVTGAGEFSKKIVGDLVDAGTVQITCVMELDDSPFTPDGVNDTITITFPTAGSTSGTLSGTGFISECTLPSIEIGGLLEQTITFVFDGETGPDYTAGT